MTRLIFFALMVASGVVACRDWFGFDVIRSESGPLRLEAAVGQTTIGLGETTRVVYRLRNMSGDTVTLGFPSSCQILPYVTGRHRDRAKERGQRDAPWVPQGA